MLYETAAPASEILSLNVEDIDLENRRAVVCSKGGDIELLHFQTGSARLLPRLIAGRTRGPLFLTDPPTGAGAGAGDRRRLPGHGSRAVVVSPRAGYFRRGVR